MSARIGKKSTTLRPMGNRVQRLFKRGEVIEAQVTDIAFGGKAIARIKTESGDFTVFIQNAVPGQLVKARIVTCKNRYAECKLEEVISPSADEQPNAYQAIPGAPYARLPIEIQHRYKELTALDLYRKIGKLEQLDEVYAGLVASPSTWHYRNKMEYSFSAIGHDPKTGEDFDGFALGFKHRGTWWMVENLDTDSGMFDADLESRLHEMRQWCENTGLPAWHPPRREGFFRFFVVRKSYFQNKLLLNLVTTSDDLERFDAEGFVAMVRGLWGDKVAGVLHTLNDDRGERVEARAGNSTLLWGDSTITERINGLDFSISMASFFQTNPASAERLYNEVIAFTGEPERADGIVLDLFCGTGTIAQLLAKKVPHRVIGVDIVESAIADARRNARLNAIDRVEFLAADAGKFLKEHPEYAGKIAALVLDPPRAGIAPKTLLKVIGLGAKRIVYVSCNPATQARDAQTLAEHGYRMTKLKLVDQFPHTSHIEAVAQFELQP